MKRTPNRRMSVPASQTHCGDSTQECVSLNDIYRKPKQRSNTFFFRSLLTSGAIAERYLSLWSTKLSSPLDLPLRFLPSSQDAVAERVRLNVDDLYFFALTPNDKLAMGKVFPRNECARDGETDRLISEAVDNVFKSIRAYEAGHLDLSCGLIKYKVDSYSILCAHKFLLDGEETENYFYRPLGWQPAFSLQSRNSSTRREFKSESGAGTDFSRNAKSRGAGMLALASSTNFDVRNGESFPRSCEINPHLISQNLFGKVGRPFRSRSRRK